MSTLFPDGGKSRIHGFQRSFYISYITTPLFFLALFGHIGYWLLWKYAFPQPYESVPLRVVCVILVCWPIVFRTRHFNQKWSWYYVYAIFVINVPFFFTFMYLANGVENRVWQMSLVCAIYLTFFCFKVSAAVVSFVLGAGIALAAIHFHPVGKFQDSQILASLDVLPIFAFALMTALAVARNRDNRIQASLEGAWHALAVLAHEVRSPLFALRAGLHPIAASDELRGEQSMFVRRMLRRIDDMNGIINLHLDNLRRTTAHEPINCDPVAVIDVVSEAIETVDADLVGTTITLRTAQPCTVAGDAAGIRQIIVNLLKNAKTAVLAESSGTGGGNIHIDVIQDGKRCVVSVEDSAGSLSQVATHKLFSPFYSTSKKGGIGMGLYASRMIARQMGGDLTVACTPGKFTRFSLELRTA